MTFSVKHAFVSLKADGSDPTIVKPSDWNEEHELVTTVTAGIVLGARVGSAEISELPIRVSADGSTRIGSTGSFTPPIGTSAQRPSTAPAPGSLRYNSELGTLEVYGLNGSSTWTSLGGIGGNIPAGALQFFATAVPDGWFHCNGQAISRTAPLSRNLFAVVGTYFGPGNGTTTFNVPNYLEATLINTGPLWGPGGIQGANNVTLGLQNIPRHSHHVDTTVYPDPGLGGSGSGINMMHNVGAGVTSGVGGGSDGNAVPISVMQKSATAYLCIKG